MTNRLINPVPQFLDAAGNPLIGGLLYFYESATSTDKDTFSDPELTIKNSNPVIIQSDGRTPDVFFSGSAKVVLKDSDDVQIWERDPVSTEDFGSEFSNWLSTTIYSQSNIVKASDSNYYLSRTNNNIGNDPLSSSEWQKIFFTTEFSIFKTYQTGEEVVLPSNGQKYISLIDDNLGNDPATNPTKWTGYALSVTQLYARRMKTRLLVLTGNITIQKDFRYIANPNAGGVTLTIPADFPVDGEFQVDLSTYDISASNPVNIVCAAGAPDLGVSGRRSWTVNDNSDFIHYRHDGSINRIERIG